MSKKDINSKAEAIYRQGLSNVKINPEPEGQKFPCGSRVAIAGDLGSGMSHFPKGVGATVKYTYAHAYGGKDIKAYCLDVDGFGSVSWYNESQLTQE